MPQDIHQLRYEGTSSCIQLRLQSPLNKTVTQTYDGKTFVK
jgi:hypothetical protein